MMIKTAPNKRVGSRVGLFVSSESYDSNFDWSAFGWDRSDPAACRNISGYSTVMLSKLNLIDAI